MRLGYYLRQSLNLPGLLQSIKTLSRPQLLLPNLYVDSINHIDINQLKGLGVTCVVFDKDNTLSLTYTTEIHHSLQSKVNEFKLLFPDSIAILSNSAGSCDDTDFTEAKLVEAKLDIPVIRHISKKPNCISEVSKYYEFVSCSRCHLIYDI